MDVWPLPANRIRQFGTRSSHEAAVTKRHAVNMCTGHAQALQVGIFVTRHPWPILMLKKITNLFHCRKLCDRSRSTVSLNDNISKSAIPPAVNPNQSQDTLLNPRIASLHSAAPSRVDAANQAPGPRSEECSTSLRPSQQYALVKAGSVAWKGLETALRLLEKSAGAFPPLKSALGGLLACLDLTQVNYCFGFHLH